MRLPNDSNRLLVLGRTGSGKTVAGVWHLSKRAYNRRPWIVLNQKGDALIDAIPGTVEMDIADKPPKQPGIYIVRPIPDIDDDALDRLMCNCWERGNIGLYFDEGYMLPRGSRGLRLIQTQGRSLRVPTITLSQRPVWLDRFVFSEADFIQLFHLNDDRDKLTIASFMPRDAKQDLPQYHSWYYDVPKNNLLALQPVPMEDEILNRFDVQKPKRKISI